MDLSQHIRISGTFVIFQGIYGDGLRNTIDYIEPLVSIFDVNVNEHDNNNEGVTNNHIVNQERSLCIPNETTTISDTDDMALLSTSSRSSIVTPPPTGPILPTTGIATSIESVTIVPGVNECKDSPYATTMPTSMISETYIPPTKVAKVSTLEETITAISNTTISSEPSTYQNVNVIPRRRPPQHRVVTMDVEENAALELLSIHETDPDKKLQRSEHSEVISSDGDFDDDVPVVVSNPQHMTDTGEHHHLLAQIWERECRAIELYHRKEWYESALSQTTTTTVYSSNSRTEKERFSNILHPQHGMAFTGKEGDSNCDDSNISNIDPSIPWWMSTETGCVAILDQIPTPPIRIQALPQLFGVGLRSNIMLPSPTQCHQIGSLLPGTIIVATELITLCSNNNDPTVPVFTPIAIRPINHGDDKVLRSDQRDTATKIYLPGRLGWIQILKIISPMSGYCVLSIDGYTFAGQGLPHQYIPGGRSPPSIENFFTSNPDHGREHILINNKQTNNNKKDSVIQGWYWRVMCIEGAYVRNGVDLTSHHVATIPYGTLVRVLRKSINAMGLSRLQIEAIYYKSASTMTTRYDSDHPQYITGWISEFLNPLSGQRGPIVLPLPFPVPALYAVSLQEGAIIRSDVELSSPIIGHAPFGTVVSVIGCTYTDQPKDQCVARFRLAGNGGFINVKLNVPPPHDYPIVQYIGIDDDFNPNEPKTFHYRSVQNNIANCSDPSRILMVGKNNPMTQQQRRVLEQFSDCSNDEDDADHHIHHIDHNNNDSDIEIHPQPSHVPMDSQRQSQHDTTTTTTTGTTKNIAATTLRKKGPGRVSSHHARYLCVICLCEERTATIIHGETGHIVCCLMCARILKARGDHCPVCRLPIDSVIQHFWA